MNDAERITADRLRIVVDNGEAELKRRPTKPKAKRRPQRQFTQVPLGWLNDSYYRKRISPEMRLYLVLQYATKQGTRTVRLTNDLAAYAYVTRHHKPHYLRKLEAQGLITVVRHGNRNPEVSLTGCSQLMDTWCPMAYGALVPHGFGGAAPPHLFLFLFLFLFYWRWRDD